MAKVCADIKPTGLRQRDEVDLFYDIVSSIYGICVKLDADAGVPLTTYTANCFTALFNGSIEDSRGNTISNFLTPSATVPEPVFISPRGIGGKERVDLLYMILDMLETLTEQCDTDVLGDSNYEAVNYTAIVLYLVTNSKSRTLGNGTAFTFHAASTPQKELVELLYQIVRSIHLTTAKLDADGNVTDTDYDSLWYTNNILLTVENGSGSSIGN